MAPIPELFWIKVALGVVSGATLLFLGICGFIAVIVINHKEKIASLEGAVVDKGKERMAAVEAKSTIHEQTFGEIRQSLHALGEKLDRLIETRGNG